MTMAEDYLSQIVAVTLKSPKAASSESDGSDGDGPK